MAAGLVQTAQVTDTNSPNAGGTIAFGSNVTAGSTLIFGFFDWYTSFAPSSVTDTQSNTWAFSALGSSFGSTSGVYTTVASSSGACTITVNASSGTARKGAFLLEVSGLQSNPYDTNSTAVSNSSSPVSAGSITPSANGAYIVAYFSRNGVSSSYSTNSTFTFRAQAPSAGSDGLGDYTQTTAGAITPTLTASVNASYQVTGMAIAFKATATATGVVGKSVTKSQAVNRASTY